MKFSSLTKDSTDGAQLRRLSLKDAIIYSGYIVTRKVNDSANKYQAGREEDSTAQERRHHLVYVLIPAELRSCHFTSCLQGRYKSFPPRETRSPERRRAADSAPWRLPGSVLL